MDDEQDLKKIIEFIESSKEGATQDLQYDDFINYDNSDVEEVEETIYFENDYDFTNFTGTDISKLNSYDPRSVLKPEEQVVIDSCSDLELKQLLLLNRTKNFQLMQMYKNLKDLLIQCQKDIKDKSEVIHNFLKANKEQTRSSGAWRLAAPYFKDKRLYTCPSNADTVRKQANKELNVYDITASQKWSSFECEKLLRAVKLNYNISQQNDVLKKIKILQQSERNSEPKALEDLKELEERKKELQDEDNSEIPPLNSDRCIDWMRVAEVFLQDKRTSFECKSFWHIYLHPSINKSPWTPEENSTLKKLAKKYKFQDWDKIAVELGNNRTGFTACVNYCSNLHEKIKKGDFTDEEDLRLVQLVHRHKMGNYIPWVKIVQDFKKRTRAQLHYRYTYYLSQNDKRKGKFTDAEDVLLMILVDRFGKNFKKCSEYMPTRSMVQIKARYNSNLQQKLKKGLYTKEEDAAIMKYVEEHGDKSWTKLTKIMQRCRGQLRQRYNTISAFLARNPNSTLDAVPRRKHSHKDTEDPFNFLRMVADQFVDSPNIPLLNELEIVLQNRQQLAEGPPLTAENISKYPCGTDAMLTNFFCNSFKMNPTKCISSAGVERAVRDVKTVLKILKADLDIPQNFDEDVRLDNLDVAILNILADEPPEENWGKKGISEALPPSLNGLVGLRSLLIKHSTNKSDNNQSEDIFASTSRKQHHIFEVKSDIMKNLLSLPDETRLDVENDRRLFYQRFQTLFKLPAVMTLVNPSLELLGSSTGGLNPGTLQVKRTYSKADRNKTAEPPKKQTEIREMPSTSTKAVPLANKSNNEQSETIKKQQQHNTFDVESDNMKQSFSLRAETKLGAENKMEITEMPGTSTKAVPLTLTPVRNKSILADLIKNKNKKLFAMEAVKCGSETRMVIKEVNIRSADGKQLNVTDGVNGTKSGNDVQEELVDSGTSSVGTGCEEPSAKKRKLSRFVPEHGQCIILNSEEDYFSSGDEVDDAKDDLNDLDKLHTFLDAFQCKDVAKDDDDLEDLKKLEDFLKQQEESGTDSLIQL